MAEDGISIDIEGLIDVQKMLDDLGTKAAERCIRKALKAGAAIEQAAIVELAPVKVGRGGILPDGALKSDIVVKMGRDEQGGIIASVGPDSYTEKVAGWVEYGHRKVTGGYNKLIKFGKNAGKTRGPGKVHSEDVEAHSFIRTAYEATQQKVAETICSVLATEVEAAALKGGK